PAGNARKRSNLSAMASKSDMLINPHAAGAATEAEFQIPDSRFQIPLISSLGIWNRALGITSFRPELRAPRGEVTGAESTLGGRVDLEPGCGVGGLSRMGMRGRRRGADEQSEHGTTQEDPGGMEPRHQGEEEGRGGDR